MGRSKNDVPCGGGTARIKTLVTKYKTYYAVIALINPRTHKPYRYGEIIQDLRTQAQSFPEYSDEYTRAIDTITAKCKGKLSAEVWTGVTGPTPQAAEERRKTLVWPWVEQIARLLTRTYVRQRTRAGTITIQEYVTHFMDTLFTALNPKAESQCRSLTNRIILPAIGTVTVLSLQDPTKRAAMMARVDTALRANGLQETQCGYTRRAMTCLLQHLVAAGFVIKADPQMVAADIGRHSTNRTPMYRALTPDHLDAPAREQMFRCLRDRLEEPAVLAIAAWIGLVYSGLTFEEIACLTFGEIQRVVLAQGSIFTALIYRTKRKKSESRYGVLSATNDRYAVYHFRRIVVTSWGAALVERYARYLQAQYSYISIKNVNLACDPQAPYHSYDPDVMTELVDSFLECCPVGNSSALRADKSGTPTVVARHPDAAMLPGDAQYVARQLCGLGDVAFHATFGTPKTTVDEKDYLYALSYRYALQRYVRLCRYCPDAFAAPDDSVRYAHSETWRNPGDSPQLLEFHARFGTSYVVHTSHGGPDDTAVQHETEEVTDAQQ